MYNTILYKYDVYKKGQFHVAILARYIRHIFIYMYNTYVQPVNSNYSYTSNNCDSSNNSNAMNNQQR